MKKILPGTGAAILLMVMFSLLNAAQLSAADPAQTVSLIASVTEKDTSTPGGAYSEYAQDINNDTIITYDYDSRGLLSGRTLKQASGNTYQYRYTYNDEGELTYERDGDNSTSYEFTYDEEGRPVTEIRDNGSSRKVDFKWTNGNCSEYAGIEYTCDSAGRIVSSRKPNAAMSVNGKIIRAAEEYVYTYDSKQNICRADRTYSDLSQTFSFSMTYTNGVVTKAHDSTYNDEYQITYKQALVPARYAKIVKAQQKILLHDLNKSAPYIMTRLQFASAGNLVKEEPAQPEQKEDTAGKESAGGEGEEPKNSADSENGSSLTDGSGKKDDVSAPVQAKKKTAKIKVSQTKVKKGKKTTVRITSSAKTKVTVKGNNALAKNRKYVRITNGKTAKLIFAKKAKKGKYTFKAASAAGGLYKKLTKTVTIKVK